MIARNISGYCIIATWVLKRSNQKRKDLEACVLLNVLGKSLCLNLGHYMGKNVKELLWKYDVWVMNHCSCLERVSISVEHCISRRILSLSNRKIVQCVVLESMGYSWAALTLWPGFSSLILPVFTALPDKGKLLLCCALVLPKEHFQEASEIFLRYLLLRLHNIQNGKCWKRLKGTRSFIMWIFIYFF